jgi:tetratricopeptide (TPR) repeat protein
MGSMATTKYLPVLFGYAVFELSPPSILVNNFLEQGNARLNHKDYQGAIEYFTHAARLKPDYVEAYKGRGYARFLLKDYQRAVEDYTHAIHLMQDKGTFLTPSYEIYSLRGIARVLLKNYNGAIEDFTTVIRHARDKAQAYSLRGAPRALLEDYQGAESDWQKAADLFLESGDMKGYQDVIDKQRMLRRCAPSVEAENPE